MRVWEGASEKRRALENIMNCSAEENVMEASGKAAEAAEEEDDREGKGRLRIVWMEDKGTVKGEMNHCEQNP
jgi:hypothetical protein